MRFVTLLSLLCAVPGIAGAQTPDCRTIPKASDRLACYDKAAPPMASGKTSAANAATRARAAPAAQKPAPGQPAQSADLLAVENSKLDAKIKNICRGC